MEEVKCPACERYKATPRGEDEIKDLKVRLNRIIGQLNGITKMLDDNRYCGDILTQIAASESALQQVGYILLKSHMETCVSEDIKSGKEDSLQEAFELMRKLK
ncbi:MAG: metal-sensing transcriptional repressor [Erysipelotrichaceae bacterium]|nr:metal-sensing transcriptional repressor [Erysipelotrichaceae bacterium]